MTSSRIPLEVIAPPETIVPGWTLADRLRKIRRDVADADQHTFSAQLGVTQGAYAAWESGRNQPRDLVSFCKRIELLTGVPASWTLGLDQPAVAADVTADKGTTKGSCSTGAGHDAMRPAVALNLADGSIHSAEWLSVA